ncbi:Golgin candidate 5 [Linum grandiflorum]
MAWFSGKVSLGNLDLAGAVNKLSESVKNIEKNFDNALGFEEKPPSSSDSSPNAEGLWPMMSWNKGDDVDEESPEKTKSPQKSATDEDFKEENTSNESAEKTVSPQKSSTVKESRESEDDDAESAKKSGSPHILSVDSSEKAQSPQRLSSSEDQEVRKSASADSVPQENEEVETRSADEHLETAEREEGKTSEPGIEDLQNQSQTIPAEQADSRIEPLDSVVDRQDSEVSGSQAVEVLDSMNSNIEAVEPVEPGLVGDMSIAQGELRESIEMHPSEYEEKKEEISEGGPAEAERSSQPEAVSDGPTGARVEQSDLQPVVDKEGEVDHEASVSSGLSSERASDASISNVNSTDIMAVGMEKQVHDGGVDVEGENLDVGLHSSTSMHYELEREKLKKEMHMMEAALQGAARQAQAKADEIAKLMTENEHLKTLIEDLKRKSNDAEVESLREEYHQRVATLERKVYALTKERDTLRREQNKKSDAAALLKEKDEIITQVMAEGEELSKKQAAQESTMRKLRAQIRELEEEKKGLTTKLQVEENKAESIKKDKTATETLLQETIEKHQAELAAQEEYYTNALTAAREAEALAEARVNSEARVELENLLREAGERETMLVQALEELRQTLSRKDQQAVYMEDMHRREIEDLQKRYQASERRCEELVSQVPDSTRPLLRQIEAMQETMSRRAEAWNAVERSLSSRLQEAEGKAAAAEEKERSMNDRLSQTLSRINVLEAQISCLRAEQTQLSKSIEKERQRAAENRQEYLAAKEEADTHEGRANQLEEEIKELRRKHKQELQEALVQKERLQQEVEREKAARLELERTKRLQSAGSLDHTPIARTQSAVENGHTTRKLSNAGSVEESYFLQATLDASNSYSDRRSSGETTVSPYYVKSMTPSAFESALRQKEGELASYMSRLASLESIRDSLAEELVKMTEQCEKLRADSALLPGIRAELDALRRRHSAALELMGERDEELEELRADIVDLKEMYREQVNLLVNKIQQTNSSVS